MARSIEELLTMPDRAAAFIGLTQRYVQGNESDRRAIITGWDFGVDWKYPNWQRLACNTGDGYTPGEKIRAFLASHAITSANPPADARDELVGLAIVFQSAVAAGLDANQEFQYVASISPPAVRALLEGFAGRDDADKSLAAFGLARVLNGDGEIEIHLDAKAWPNTAT